ncbi:MAG: diguanylate cyclase [Pseudomonadota bacterium]
MPRKQGLSSSGDGEQILVVDDDSNIGEIIQSALLRVGIEPVVVSSPGEALAAFDKSPFDLIISDLNMPDLDGIELISRLKELDPDLAAILMTGYGTKETVIKAFTKGKINYFLSKPFKIDDLLSVVSAAVKERRLKLSELEFRERLEKEINNATSELERKNIQLQNKQRETEFLNRELQARNQEMEKTKNYLEGLLESSIDGIVTTDLDFNITFFSRGAKAMLGFDPEETVVGPLQGFFLAGDDGYNRLLDRIATQKRVRNFECDLRKKNGPILSSDISTSPLKQGTEAKGRLFIIKDVTDRKRLENELLAKNIHLRKLSITDGLTGLGNHRYFQKKLSEEFNRAKRFRTSLTLIMLDLDDFKQVNDTHGHQAGDQVLTQVGEIIQASVREVDTPARYGGEEFAIILPQTELDNAVMVAERLKHSLEFSHRFQEIRPGLKLTASMGVACFPDAGVRTSQDLIRFADKALYRAKQIGKNRVVIGGAEGERPLGPGEILSQGEKKIILRRVTDTLRGALDLDKILNVILREISDAARRDALEPPACSIMLMDKNQGLKIRAELNPNEKKRADFDISAHLALEKRSIHVFSEWEEHGPTASFPIITPLEHQGEEVVGVINIGEVPTDLDFFRDLTGQASLGIVKAKLFSEVENSRSTLETKVNQLMTLSLMGMALQRNALNFENFSRENKMLLARCLARVGFEAVYVYDLDREGKRLFDGVDDSLRGENAPPVISLSALEEDSRLFQLIFTTPQQAAPLFFFPARGDLTPAEKELVDEVNTGGKELAAAVIIQNALPTGLVFALKDRLLDEDLEALSMFVLHAGLIMENLELTRKYQEKTRRLTLLHQIGLNISTASSIQARTVAAQEALDALGQVLKASEISVYLYSTNLEDLELWSYTSASAKSKSRPSPRTTPEQSRIMGRVVKNVLEAGQTTPVIFNNLEEEFGKKLKKRFATPSYMGLPLFGGGEFLGVMNVTDKADHSQFTFEDAELAQITAGMLGTVLCSLCLGKTIEEEITQASGALLEYLEKSLTGTDQAESRRVTGLAETLAETMGVSSLVHKRIKKAALFRGFKKLPLQADVSPNGPTASVLEILLPLLEKLSTVTPEWGACSSGLNKTNWEIQDSALSRIIPVAESFDLNYWGRKAQSRPSLGKVLVEMLDRADRDFDPEALEALLKNIAWKKIRNGRKRLPADEADITTVREWLEAVMAGTIETRLTPDLAKRFWEVLK